ncbi:hypothetical protein [Lacihabitans lacunae]|uniref:Outer membrane lipoprotein-sorting protein n=1 Tax=Lacihabitans lacunae TaxID=1028214 RepID=A0ABV7YWT2_9BACT
MTKSNFKKISLLALSILSFNAAIAQTADEVIAKFEDSIGGKEVLSTVKSYSYERSYKANAATDYDEEVSAVIAENKFTRKKSILGRDFFYVLNNNSGWIKIPMGSRDKAPTYSVKDLNASERGALADELAEGLYPFINYSAKGLKLVGSVKSANIEGKACYQLSFEKGDSKREYYFDKTTGLLNREVVLENNITITTDHTKYSTTAEGLKYPSESNLYSTKDKKNTAVTTKLNTAPSFDAAMFVK